MRGIITVGVFLGLSGGIFVGPRPSCYPHNQEKEQGPRFYALGVVCEKDVQNAKDSLGAPDGRYAEILPGGQLVVFMEKKIYPLPFIGGNPEAPGLPDSGSVVGKGGADFGLEGWLPMQDTEDKQHYAWTPLGVSGSGFCLLPTYCMGVDMIRITDLGTKSLFVDAVIGYGMEAVEKASIDMQKTS